MDIPALLNDKTLKPKQKTETLSAWLLEGSIHADALVQFAEASKDPVKATCIEALEFASKQQPGIVSKKVFRFVMASLAAKAPRVKWESAKVVANTAAQFPGELYEAIQHLLVNTTHEGTVVRWSAATALGEIAKLRTQHNQHLLPMLQALSEREEKNSIRKIYLDALKKASK